MSAEDAAIAKLLRASTLLTLLLLLAFDNMSNDAPRIALLPPEGS